MDRFSRLPLYMQLKDDILSKIENDEWQVGIQIPSEKELMYTNDVGRETVRKAIAILVQEGYLVKKRGIGTFVAKKKPAIGFEPLISLSHILQVRGLKDRNKVLVNKVISIDDEIAKLTKMSLEDECRYIERLRYVDGKPLALEYTYLKNESNDKAYNFEKSISRYILEVLNKTIEKIEQVITIKEPTEEEKKLLKVDEDTKLLEMDRWIYIKDEDGVYFYIKFIVPSDIYNLAF
ncbi:GntR family transcriptional regulator [Vallitalea okinawensis]|uniref:GntR family transcriptional regulator n=1 Tax=Vallitalea okinawensis TaxID=2078660 RepID=UPI0014788B77|nr:GntR family transcriptional regulator [Vallitalea okinawensis]